MDTSKIRKRVVVVGVLAGAMLGGAGLASAVSNGSTPSQPVTTTADTVVGQNATAGKDTSNNDPAHEAGESAAVEAAETAGKGHGPGDGDGDGGPGGHHHGHSNTDPAHEAAESPARAAQEAADDAAIATSTTTAG